MSGESPILVQYRGIKRRYADNVLFFRLGDFYEMFAEDAIEVSAMLNLTLTSRNGIPMCGVPYHSARSYIARLLKYGKKIAICEQLGTPQKGKGIIERDVVEVITPGTTVDEDFLDRGNCNYLAAICSGTGVGSGTRYGFACLELSTGEFEAFSFDENISIQALRTELERLDIKEIIVQESLLNTELGRTISVRSSLVINRRMDWLFDSEKSFDMLTRQFGTENLKAFGLEYDAVEIPAAGAILEYVSDTAKTFMPHIRRINIRDDGEYTGLDESALRNLELLRGMRDGNEEFSLIKILDETKTAMGKRLLKQRVTHPLRDIKKIRARHDLVSVFYTDRGFLTSIRETSTNTPDIERHLSRLAMRKSHGKDMLSLKNAIVRFLKIYSLCAAKKITYENIMANKEFDTKNLFELSNLLERALPDNPSILLTEGNLIRSGYCTELDNLHDLRDNGRKLLEDYLDEERAATGISSLKIRYNRLIGYFFEVTKLHLAKTPPHFIRRQGVAGGERFTTDRLVSLESDINGAQEKIIELEKKLFVELREHTATFISDIGIAAQIFAELDAAQSLATAATNHGWVRPSVDNINRIHIRAGRHPAVEAHIPRGTFIPNDTMLDADNAPSFALITGPNMAGKSTYLRQCALIVVMAQMGSFVPAASAEIGIVDKIFCRVGAHDNLAGGESTFLVEMNETAFILNTATKYSLVIMDEVGRGTGTLDGLSIAQAVCEALLDRICCRTLFATHYHELADIKHRKLVMRSMQVDDVGGTIIFRRRLVEGAATESYGLHVARIAGLDEGVCRRAEEIMAFIKSCSRQTAVKRKNTEEKSETTPSLFD